MLLLQLSLASSEVPNEIEKAILEAEEASNTVAELGDRKTAVQKKIKSQTADVTELVSEVGNISKEIADLERLSKYLMHILQVEDARSQPIVFIFIQYSNTKLKSPILVDL